MPRVIISIYILALSLFSSAEENKNIISFYEKKEVCEAVKEKNINKPNENARRKVFVGKSRTEYNPKDYYLWVSAFDISNDGEDDLVAIDWLQRNKNTYYLAVYVYLSDGRVYQNRRDLKKYLLGEKLSLRHGEGATPLIPEVFFLKDKEGELTEERFVGFHKIEPISIDGENYLLAEKDDSEKAQILVFHFEKNTMGLEVNCKL